ncbi:hypothetical protein B0H19DRAFT_1240544 [Mycena capillaripes]|nr:hypothetical protein B0H19DRAFT_1240544 [Mycena capillaripes]
MTVACEALQPPSSARIVSFSIHLLITASGHYYCADTPLRPLSCILICLKQRALPIDSVAGGPHPQSLLWCQPCIGGQSSPVRIRSESCTCFEDVIFFPPVVFLLWLSLRLCCSRILSALLADPTNSVVFLFRFENDSVADDPHPRRLAHDPVSYATCGGSCLFESGSIPFLSLFAYAP